MANFKKKLNVIRPTLRHKKAYFKIAFTKDEKKEKITSILLKNYQSINGIFSSIKCNLTVIECNLEKKEVLIRINKEYVDSFLTSLFFLKKELGLIVIIKKASTIKSLKGVKK